MSYDPNNPHGQGGWQGQQVQPVWNAQTQQWEYPQQQQQHQHQQHQQHGQQQYQQHGQQQYQQAHQGYGDQQQQWQQQQQQWNQQPQAQASQGWDNSAQQQQGWQQQASQQPWQQQASQQPWQQQQSQQASQPWQQDQHQSSQATDDQSSSQPWQVAGAGGGAAAAAVADSFPSADEDGRSIEGAVATLGVSDRVTFIRKTYAHLAGAIGLFTALLFAFFKVPFLVEKFVIPFTNFAVAKQINWLIVLGAFMGAGYIAEKWAQSATSRKMQYLGLLFYTVAEAIIFVPLIAIVYMLIPDPGNLLAQAGVITLALFAALSAVVLITRKDFSFLRSGLAMASMLALGTIVAAVVFGFSLGIFFSIGMCGLAGGYILYYTSRVMAHYHPQQYVAAALALFSAFTLLLWYVIRILMELRR